jgi:hypothetical protein
MFRSMRNSIRIANPQDFWAGLGFGAFGLFMSLYAATHYSIGTAVRMGPGYFPTWVGGLVAALGALLALRSVRGEGPGLSGLPWRPTIFVLVGTVAFGYLMKPLGLVASTAVLVLVTAAGGYEFRLREAVLLAIGLAVFSVAVFVYGLGLPFPLWPEFFE